MSSLKIRTVNGLPNNGRQIKELDHDSAYLSNQFAISGASGLKSPYFNDVNASVFLEYVSADAVWTLKDSLGNTIASGIPANFDGSHAPFRLDGGFELTGANFTFVKGFIIRG